MIISIAGLTNAASRPVGDVSAYLDRQQPFSVEATLSNRMDLLTMTLMDTIPPSLGVPDRAEIVVYDVPSTTNLYVSLVSKDNPFSWWRLQGGTADSGPGFYYGYNSGLQFGIPDAPITGDTSTSFNGISDEILILSYPGYQSFNWSVEAWIKTSASGLRAIFDIPGTGTLELNNGFLQFNAGASTITSPIQSNDGNWHHVVFTYSITRLAVLYVDGAVVARKALSLSPWTAGTPHIGSTGGGTFWSGLLVEVAVYHSVLSAPQVTAHYTAARAPISTAVVDPPTAISAYNSWLNGAGKEVVSSTPSAWTSRLFAGYLGKVSYRSDGGPQRYVLVTAQDYTYRLRTTVCNMAFSTQSDRSIIQTLMQRYRPDFDVLGVMQTVASYPNISFPVHTLEQFLQRMTRISRAFYRVDYWKRMTYGVTGLLSAPFNFSDSPDFVSTFPSEGLTYEPDGTGLINKVWILGATFLSATQTYAIPYASGSASQFQFPLPGDPELSQMTVSVGGVDQGAGGVAPGDGDPANQASFKFAWIIQHNPPVLMLRTTPTPGTAISIRGRFRYPLIQTVSDPKLIAEANGLIFEAIVRDRRIMDLSLAQQVGQQYLAQQGRTIKGGSLLTKYRSANNQTLAPGQQLLISNNTVYKKAIPSPLGPVVLAHAPVAWWRLGDVGRVAADSSGHGYNGSVIGGVQSAFGVPPSEVDGAMTFDGSSGWIQTASLPALGPTWSVECWFNLPTAFAPQVLCSFAGIGGFYTNTSTGRLTFSDGTHIYTVSQNVCDGRAHHAVAVYDQFGYFSLYLDSRTWFYTLATWTASAAGRGSIGADTVPQGFTAGIIDEVAVYSSGLNTTQVTAHYNAGQHLTNSVLILKTTTKLSEDINQPYEMTIDYSDRIVGGGL